MLYMNWNILGIEATRDKKAITAAYRSRLLEVNPEDKPEEFKALRSAYEEALKYADQTEEETSREESPLGLWMERVRALYDNFPDRIRPACWRELLSSEVCLALDTRAQAEEALMRFLMEDYYIPQNVWQVLDEVFSLVDRREELYETYPRDFIDYAVINGIQLQPSLSYELFIPGQNGRECDEYRRLYHKVNHCPAEEREQVLKDMMALSEQHPYGHALVFQMQIEQGDVEKGRAGLKMLAEKHPRDMNLNMRWAIACTEADDWTQTEALVRRVLEVNPDHRQAKHILAECLARKGQYDEAKEIIFELTRAFGGDQVKVRQLQETLHRWNQELIRMGEERLSTDPRDSANALKLAWCYIQNEDIESAFRASAYVDPEKENPYDYHNLMGKLHYAREEGVPALEHFLAVEKILRAALEDPTHPAAKHTYRLPEFLQIEGSCLMNLGRKKEAFGKYEEALELAPEDPAVLNHMGRLLFFQRDYERAAEICQNLVRATPQSYYGYMLLAMNLYELNRDRDAFDAVNRALDLEGSDLSVYVLKMRILLRNGVWDQVRQLLDFLARCNVGDEITVCWCRAQLVEYADKDEDQALAQYRTLASRVEQGEDFPWADQLYYRITVLLGHKLDANKAEDRQQMMEVLEKALAHEPNNEDCLNYKAWLFKKAGEKDKAVSIYRQMEALPCHSLNAEHGLAEFYYDDLSRYADQALHYYRVLLNHRESPELHFYAGTCLRYMGDFAAAEQHYLKEQELDPSDVDSYNGLAFVYEAMGRNEDALAQLNKALAVLADKEHTYSWLYNHKSPVLRRMNRHQEAIQAQDEAIQRCGHKGAYKNRFEICCQFGLWDQAKKMLDAWIKAQGVSGVTTEASIMLQLYQGKMVKATLAFTAGAKQLNAYDTDSIKMQVADLEGNPERALRVWTNRLATESDNTRTVGCLAHAQWLCGDRAGAVKTAQRALELMDQNLALHLTNKALYMSQRSRVLAILGRFDEARDALAQARSMPLCNNCVYGGCKDADVFEAEIEEIRGNRDKALELFRKGTGKWPDELDFVSGIARLTRKGK